MRPLRVSFLADTESWGGAEVWLVHHLRRAARHGVEASVVCAAQVADRFRPWVPEHRLAVVPLARHAVVAPQTSLALAAQAPDLVHVNLVDPASNAASLGAALAVAPTSATLHLQGETPPEGRQRQSLAARYADLAVLLAPSEQAAWQVRTELAEPRAGVVVTCNGVDIPAHARGPAGHRPPRIGVLARLTRQKGLDVLLAAVRRMAAAGASFEVAVGGSGREEPQLRTSSVGLPVTFAGWVEEPRRFLAGLDLFCLPSRAEALPLALLEAMAEGLPCVATDVGDVGRRVGTAVELVPPEDPDALAAALTDLLARPDRRSALGARGRALAEEQHDAAQMVSLTYGLLREAARSTLSR